MNNNVELFKAQDLYPKKPFRIRPMGWGGNTHHGFRIEYRNRTLAGHFGTIDAAMRWLGRQYTNRARYDL